MSLTVRIICLAAGGAIAIFAVVMLVMRNHSQTDRKRGMIKPISEEPSVQEMIAAGMENQETHSTGPESEQKQNNNAVFYSNPGIGDDVWYCKACGTRNDRAARYCQVCCAEHEK